jgi:hypothetical protein
LGRLIASSTPMWSASNRLCGGPAPGGFAWQRRSRKSCGK